MLLDPSEISQIKGHIEKCDLVFSQAFILFHKTTPPNENPKIHSKISAEMTNVKIGDFHLLHNFVRKWEYKKTKQK